MSDKKQEPAQTTRRPSRRAFLGGIGLGATTVVGAPLLAAAQGRFRDNEDTTGGSTATTEPTQQIETETPSTTQPVDQSAPQSVVADGPDQFSRLFDNHPAFSEADDELREMLTELGSPGGILDANDPLENGPLRLLIEPSPNNPNNPDHSAGFTFLGQFLDHDITNDAGSTLGRPTSIARSTNLRSARLDLDSVYAGGPSETPDLYTDDDPFVFQVESGGLFEDLPRNADGTARIGDGRNDENLMVAGLHAAFLLFHNNVLDRVRASGLNDEAAFAEAQRLVRWHYQWIVLHEYLPAIVGQAMVDDIVNNGRRFATGSRAQIPVEFSTSAYRFGHSQVRPSYRANLGGDNGDQFIALVFNPDMLTDTDTDNPDPDDLSGGHRAPRRFIGWQTFFDFDDGQVRPNKLIDTKISSPLFQLPIGVISNSRGEPIGPASLASRNLLRHITWGIPSGQTVAAEMGVDRLADGDLADINDVAPRLQGATPLWLYILREAEVMADGRRLGPIGGRIVAEVFLSMLDLDPDAFFAAEPDWRPTLPSRADDGDFRMADLLTVAGVDPTSRGQ